MADVPAAVCVIPAARKGKVRTLPGPSGGGAVVRPRHTNGMVARAPLDLCACEMSAQRGNMRRTCRPAVADVHPVLEAAVRKRVIPRRGAGYDLIHHDAGPGMI